MALKAMAKMNKANCYRFSIDLIISQFFKV